MGSALRRRHSGDGQATARAMQAMGGRAGGASPGGEPGLSGAPEKKRGGGLADCSTPGRASQCTGGLGAVGCRPTAVGYQPPSVTIRRHLNSNPHRLPTAVTETPTAVSHHPPSVELQPPSVTNRRHRNSNRRQSPSAVS